MQRSPTELGHSHDVHQCNTLIYSDVIHGTLCYYRGQHGAGVVCNNSILKRVFPLYCSDSKTNLDGLAMRVDDRKDRLQNWEILMMNINAFYKVSIVNYSIDC